MFKKFAFVFALCIAFSAPVSAGQPADPVSAAFDGSEDLIEGMGGTRNGGDC